MPHIVHNGEWFHFVIDKEFEYNGRVAEWNPQDDGPVFWDQEDQPMPVNRDEHPLLVDSFVTPDDNHPVISAITPNSTFLAIATNNIIGIYNLETRTLTSRLIGHEQPILRLVFTMVSLPYWRSPSNDEPPLPQYELYSQSLPEEVVSATGGGVTPDKTTTYIWPITEHGELLREIDREDLDVDYCTRVAMDSLRHKFGSIKTDFVDVFEKHLNAALRGLATRESTHDCALSAGQFPPRGSDICSHNGTTCAIIYPRNPDLRVRVDQPSICLRHRDARGVRPLDLALHRQEISWVGWSHDSAIVATASRNECCGLWDTKSGHMLCMIGPLGRTVWGGAFFSDTKHILLSSGKPAHVAVYEIGTGREVAALSVARDIKLDKRLKHFAINPTTGMVLICNGLTLLAWEPLKEGPPPLQTVFSMRVLHSKDSNDTKGGLWKMKWVDNGNKLIAQGCYGHVTFLWDIEKNLKWRFEEKEGTDVGSSDAYYIRTGGDHILTVDGDGKVRFWKVRYTLHF